MARWHPASDSRHHLPVTCTSAEPAPPSSTGSTHGGTAARLCFASKTPTSSAPHPTWSAGFLKGCSGSGSTGMKVPGLVDHTRRTFSPSVSNATGPRPRSSCLGATHTTATARPIDFASSVSAPSSEARPGNIRPRLSCTCAASHRGARGVGHASRGALQSASGQHGVRR
jgi:hypothetical protein